LLAFLAIFLPRAGASNTVTVDSMQGAIDTVVVLGNEQRRGTVERIDVRTITKMVGASGSFENILKVLPGVHSTNELSSQYSVRGGSFDENLVYVNGVEIYRPMLTRTGQQEGLSFINPNLVSSIEFSTGGFGAEFGDKMSSVLNVGYKRPKTFGGSADASLLGASAACEFASRGGNFGGVVGLRHKRSTYMLGSLDVKGEYDPSFSDIQTTLYYDLSPRTSVSFLGSYGLNRYRFTPVNRETSFGTLDNPLRFTMFYEGSESDLTENLLGALTLRYRAADKVLLGFTASAVSMVELERYDILGEYWLRQLSSEGEVQTDNANIGVGGSLDHARSYTSTRVMVGEHSGSWYHREGTLRWGLKAQHHYVSDELNRWQRIDSAGFMLPRSGDALRVSTRLSADTTVSAWQLSGFVQEAYELDLRNSRLRLTAGLRLSYAALSHELLVSPRVQVVLYPNSSKDFQLFAAAGAYHQPAFFKEMKNPQMQLNTTLTAQRSWHVTAGLSSLFTYYDIPCKLTAEGYFKLLRNIIPYKQDNVALLYDWGYRANGYVWGVDGKLSAELIRGSESWLSLSLMQARQDVIGDAYTDRSGTLVQPGYFAMANDQLLNVSLMVQDQLPHYAQWRAYLMLSYGTGLPAFAPVDNRFDAIFPMPSYRRVDAGFSYVLFDDLVNHRLRQRLGNYLRSAAITLEALNLFNSSNVSSYLWVQTVPYAGQQAGMVAVPNYLTPFRLNLRVAVSF
jgi:hypothetical protein